MRAELGDLRTDVHVDAASADVRQGGGAAVDRMRGVERDAEFALLEPGRDVRVGLGIHVWIHPETHRRPFAQATRDTVEMLQLAGRFDVEAMDRQLERLRHFRIGLADSGEHDLGRIAACGNHPRQFAARHDVEAAAESREQIDDAEIRDGLQRVADEVRDAGEGRIELAKRALEGGAGIDEARGSVPRRDVRERDRFDGEFAVTIRESGHYFPPSGCTSGTIRSGTSSPIRTGGGAGASGAPGLAGGSFNGPLMPHPVTMPTAAATSNAVTERRNIRSSMRRQFTMKLRRGSLSRANGGSR